MLFFDIISMKRVLTQLQRAAFDVFLKDKNHARFSAPY